ncbi:hypothetical protein B0T21DRAFT_431530 [Apiosordaria backusii]|uniref:Concanavalin A-like lectin/glucanase n=1 Tax=Apiosordaria backusii TaxID=314023 RepID=A0AA39ZSP4_9PEZI|nr:hypothetical protein B0T21DRAFT_431530 [Apiosordaria backusii]
MKLNLAIPFTALSLLAAITNAIPVSSPAGDFHPLSTRTDDREKVFNENWAGLGIETTTDSPLSALYGVIAVPGEFPPVPDSNPRANATFAMILGTNGNCGSGASVGIDMAIGRDGTATFEAWSASYDKTGNEMNPVNWMDEMRGARFDIQKGDEIAITFLTIKDHNNVAILWRNLRTSETMELIIKNYDTELCLTHAAWVAEIRPASTDAQLQALDFGTVVMKEMQWATEDGQLWKAGERKGPAKEKWYVNGQKDDVGEFVRELCGFFERKEDIDERGMKCTLGKIL